MDSELMIRRTIGARATLHLELNDARGTTCIDPMQFQQLISQLAMNAREAMPDDGQVTLNTQKVIFTEQDLRRLDDMPAGSYVCITIRDNGVGISDEMKQHLFEPFYSTKDRHQKAGLGLATCYGIVRQNGGNILVESGLGVGTAIHIFLPRDDTEENRKEEVQALDNLKGTETILLAEDEPLVREIAVQVLRGQGYTVIDAQNGVEALDVFRNNMDQIDLVVTDVVMPGMGGDDLAVHVRNLRPNTKILFTSGYTYGAFASSDNVLSDQTFLPKPFTAASLSRKVRETLDGS